MTLSAVHVGGSELLQWYSCRFLFSCIGFKCFLCTTLFRFLHHCAYRSPVANGWWCAALRWCLCYRPGGMFSHLHIAGSALEGDGVGVYGLLESTWDLPLLYNVIGGVWLSFSHQRLVHARGFCFRISWIIMSHFLCFRPVSSRCSCGMFRNHNLLGCMWFCIEPWSSLGFWSSSRKRFGLSVGLIDLLWIALGRGMR